MSGVIDDAYFDSVLIDWFIILVINLTVSKLWVNQ